MAPSAAAAARCGYWEYAQQVNGFVGRDGKLARLRELQAKTRLLTLVGPGGVGKTRLALRLEAELSDAFPDGTWLVDLSPVADPALVPQALGDVLGVHQPPGQSWLAELTRVLRPHRLLLVLDNCEHLIAACAELVDGLLRACPELHLLVTSLQPLGAAGETTWRVPPLSMPRAAARDIQELRASEAALCHGCGHTCRTSRSANTTHTPWPRSVGDWTGYRWRWNSWPRGSRVWA